MSEDMKKCFYCERFFCTKYHHPRNRIVCSGILPQWEWLWFLMRNVKATDTCDRFRLCNIYKQKEK